MKCQFVFPLKYEHNIFQSWYVIFMIIIFIQTDISVYSVFPENKKESYRVLLILDNNDYENIPRAIYSGNFYIIV